MSQLIIGQGEFISGGCFRAAIFYIPVLIDFVADSKFDRGIPLPGIICIRPLAVTKNKGTPALCKIRA